MGPAVPIGKEVVKIDELGTAERAFELLAGGVLGVSANLGAAFGTECSFSWSSWWSLLACGG